MFEGGTGWLERPLRRSRWVRGGHSGEKALAMTRYSRSRCFVVLSSALLGVSVPVLASNDTGPAPRFTAGHQVTPMSAELSGVVQDEQGRPVAGVQVSAQGPGMVSAVSDAQGRFNLRNLTPGPYLLRAHRQGYLPARTRVVRLQAGERRGLQQIQLTAEEAVPSLLAAGVGAVGTSQPDPMPAQGVVEDTHEHDEVAWRLRRVKRSVLKDVENAVAELGADAPEHGRLAGFGRTLGDSARYATTLFSDLAVNGELNLLTTTTFDRPQDLFTMGADAPRGVAYLALAVPGASGEWSVRGTVTQGDVASWILAGAYAKRAPAAHQYEAGLSYSMQRYLGGNSDALTAIRDGARNVGALYGYDHWTISPRFRLDYGARYASYDYLDRPGLVSPQTSISVRPSTRDSLTFHVSAAHLEIAPGADEFLPPAVGLYLPPERTFSSVARDQRFRAERLDHFEVLAEREISGVLVGVRGFQERVADQGVTLFGAGLRQPKAGLGHYYVGSAGTVDATGWGVQVTRALTEHLRAAVEYTQLESTWDRRSPDAGALARLAKAILRHDERVHDVTARVEGLIASSATRMLVVYKANTAFTAGASGTAAPAFDTRFDVQVNQPMPFLKLTSASWEMLVAVSNLFHDDAFQGSVYDELLVARPPTRVMGGVTVRF
jgi:hypothetical protein